MACIDNLICTVMASLPSQTPAQLGDSREKSEAPSELSETTITETKRLKKLGKLHLRRDNSGAIHIKSGRRTPKGVPPSLVASMKTKCKVDHEVEKLLGMSSRNPAAVFESSPMAISGSRVRDLQGLYEFGVKLNKSSNAFVRALFCVVITDGNDIANPRQRNTGLVGVHNMATQFQRALEEGQELVQPEKIITNGHSWVTTGAGYRKLADDLSEGSLAILPSIMPGDQM